MVHNYYMPTRVIMGKDCITQNSGIFKSLGKKALIVTGALSAKRNGSEKDIKNALDSMGIDHIVFDQVMSNPTVSCVYEGAMVARENNVDFIIAIGGGSPMDAGKAIALLAVQDIDEESLFSGEFENKVLPMVLVPTTAGTGSEVTPYSVLTNEKAQTKMSIASDLLFPKVAFLDSKYMDDLPLITTINTAIDALSHAVEGMLSIKASTFSNVLAMESIRMIMNCVPDMIQALTETERLIDSAKREELLQASFIAGMVIAQTGTTAVHAMGYPLTYFKDIDHGRANGLLLGEYLRFVEKEQPDLVRRILGAMNLSEVEQFKALINRLLGEKEEISSEEIDHFSQTIQKKKLATSVVKPNEEDIKEMFIQSFMK